MRWSVASLLAERKCATGVRLSELLSASKSWSETSSAGLSLARPAARLRAGNCCREDPGEVCLFEASGVPENTVTPVSGASAAQPEMGGRGLEAERENVVFRRSARRARGRDTRCSERQRSSSDRPSEATTFAESFSTRCLLVLESRPPFGQVRPRGAASSGFWWAEECPQGRVGDPRCGEAETPWRAPREPARGRQRRTAATMAPTTGSVQQARNITHRSNALPVARCAWSAISKLRTAKIGGPYP